ncbi:Hypothetical protein Minf_2451 [Methylacidiphilum infernorum V4]|uniref:Uncharacterized protein n=1 Tax=Methylacidiphilum infernorum (isolate V4) TaxID=481448 RepID=B3E128_METI4|nr:Hypothetical protein Minf_2451 [Methylacidiphilum infernorum V4]
MSIKQAARKKDKKTKAGQKRDHFFAPIVILISKA